MMMMMTMTMTMRLAVTNPPPPACFFSSFSVSVRQKFCILSSTSISSCTKHLVLLGRVFFGESFREEECQELQEEFQEQHQQRGSPGE